MGNRKRTRDTFGHDERLTERCKRLQKPGALAGLEQNATAPTEVEKPLPAVDLTAWGIVESRRRLAGFTDVDHFFKERVDWLKRSRQLSVCTRVTIQKTGVNTVKIIGIVQNDNHGAVGSIIIDVSDILPGQPHVANRYVLIDPADWDKLCQAPKKAQPATATD